MREIKELMDAAGVEAAIAGIADKVAAREGFDSGTVAYLGIRRRGAPLARRLAEAVASRHGVSGPVGELDITLYRDDLSQKADQPIVGVTDIAFSIDGKILVLVDDVIYTGRTVRSALAALTDYGRPRGVWLAALVDRGWRELPIHPDFVGMTCETASKDVVEVRLQETDGVDRVALMNTE